MQRIFEFADSEISRIDRLADGLHIHFSAAMLRLGSAAASPTLAGLAGWPQGSCAWRCWAP